MTLLELAKYKECSLQAIQAQIEQATGEHIPLKKDHEVSENILYSEPLFPRFSEIRNAIPPQYDRQVTTPAWKFYV